MNLRVLIFDNDPSILSLLKVFLEKSGHQVQAYTDPFSCPLLATTECQCPKTQPCADALLYNVKIPSLSGIDFLLEQNRRGCKLSNQNKAVMSACMTPDQDALIRRNGFWTLRKPFKLAELQGWLKECARRISEE